MQIKHHPFRAFDARSVMLFTALTLGSGMAVHAQTQPGGLHPANSAKPAEAAKGSAKKDSSSDVFDRADTNRDGHLSVQEAARIPAIAQRFKELDADANGQLSRAEFERGAGS